MRPFPDVVRLEPAGVCNFRCKHCPVGVEGGHRNILSFENFVKFFEMLPLVPRVLILYHGGEPLLNRDLEKMIAYAKDKGVSKVAFNTNAALLTPKRDLSQVDELRVSFDGNSPEENDAIRVNSHFSKHAEQVRNLAMSDKRPQSIKIYNARYEAARPADYLLDYFEGCVNVTFEGVKIRQWARVGNKPHEMNGTKFCSNLMETFTILSDGSVTTCCEDLQAEEIKGNLRDNTPLEIWERMEQTRHDFETMNYPKLCQSCWITRRN